MATFDQRVHLGSLLTFACGHPQSFHYLAQRPMTTMGLYERDLVTAKPGTLSMDCSEFTKWMFKMAGLKDPTGYGYEPFGNSNSMYTTLAHFPDPRATRLGTIVVFGPSGADHAAIVCEGSLVDPVLASHGSSNGPEKLPLSAFTSEYSEHTFLDVGGL